MIEIHVEPILFSHLGFYLYDFIAVADSQVIACFGLDDGSAECAFFPGDIDDESTAGTESLYPAIGPG
jgi:hypothetical protein